MMGKKFVNHELNNAISEWLAVAPLSTHPLDRKRLAKVAYQSVKHKEFLTEDIIAELTGFNIDDNYIKEAITMYEGMCYMCEYLKDIKELTFD